MSNVSYEKYMKDQLSTTSSNFSLKSYKTANLEEWMGFERGKDLRIQICWKGTCIWEWVTEKSFWIQNNTNKDDRVYMRRHADAKLSACRNALVKKKPTETKTKMFLKEKSKVGQTQNLFENMKKS